MVLQRVGHDWATFTSLLQVLLLLLLLLSRFSRVRLFTTPWTAAHQAPPSLGFFRQEHWSGLPFPSPMQESEKWKWSRSVVSNSSRPHGRQPTRLLRPWDFPGKSTGVGCHCLLCLQVVLSDKESTFQCMGHGFDPWVGKIPWRRAWQPTPVFLPGESHGERSLAGYSWWDLKESETTERLNNDIYIHTFSQNIYVSMYLCMHVTTYIILKNLTSSNLSFLTLRRCLGFHPNYLMLNMLSGFIYFYIKMLKPLSFIDRWSMVGIFFF